MGIKLNTVVLAGNLVKDPIVRELQGGLKKAELRLAVDNSRVGEDGQRVERPCFVDVEVWRKQAELAESYLKKGRGIIVEGRLDYEQWTDKEGHPHSRVKVVCSHFTFVPKAADHRSPLEGGTGSEDTAQPGRTERPAEVCGMTNPISAVAAAAGGDDDFPF